ncbi:hypothetical protein OUZ56_015642 [Daphnia magna]|uniref:Peptidase S1 domain-containing protein n=1 Tax=Daphnia magna TaxID=35525 RepID=A0ABR0AND8_9CRUS|nr:hypothetical protein OUZ56_015642 [Daphnia magna]
MRIIFLFAWVLCGLFLNGWCEEEDDETDKIVSGYRVPNNRVYPYMIQFKYFSAKLFHTCGTDEHRNSRRSVGLHNIAERYPCRQASANHDNIAVVTLDTEVLASSVTPVPLGYTSFPKIGIDQLVTVGWGYTGNTVSAYLYHGPLRLIQDSSCRAVFGNVDNAYTICASYTNVGACTFDVGSPILFNGMQIGVVGKNMRCGGSEPIVASLFIVKQPSIGLIRTELALPFYGRDAVYKFDELMND